MFNRIDPKLRATAKLMVDPANWNEAHVRHATSSRGTKGTGDRYGSQNKYPILKRDCGEKGKDLERSGGFGSRPRSSAGALQRRSCLFAGIDRSDLDYGI